MARHLFGTDGMRGIAGEYPLDAKTINAAGFALAKLRPGRVVIGMDTRESGPAMAAELAGGLRAGGAEAVLAGITTTPEIAYLTKTGPFSAGVMISASHNPYRDNGIKVIDHSGYKLPDQEEEKLEAGIFAWGEEKTAAVELSPDPALAERYVEHLGSVLKSKWDGISIVVDCANGSASAIAPGLFERLGAKVHSLAAAPNGKNINLGCGSLHLEGLQRAVLEHGAELGIAFDGDADRALFVARSGKIVDGDAVLLLNARDLGVPLVVATVMSNLGLERALARDGIRLVRTPVGDKYVLEEMLRSGAKLGGEQSGHIIFLDYATTGDGILTALRVLDIVSRHRKGLDELTEDLEVYPQRLVNVPIKGRKPLDSLPLVRDEIRAAEAEFGDQGRVLVRFSGTEPLARVMVEGPDLPRVEAFARSIASRIQTELGAE